jgi:hypothetical protein
MTPGKNWLITQAQIASGDIADAIRPVDPEDLAEAELYGLHGCVRLRVEGANGPADLFATPGPRTFFRNLHERWPWAGYFLRLAPISTQSPRQQIIDLSLFMSLALCHMNRLTYVETPKGVGLNYDADELRRHLADLRSRAADLASAAGIPGNEITRRDALITRAVASFFEAGAAFRRNNPNP